MQNSSVREIDNKGALSRFSLFAIILILGITCIPILAHAGCPNWNYTGCLEYYGPEQKNSDHHWILEQCSCCVVNSSISGKWSLSQLCNPNNISSCDKPIGIAIEQKNYINLYLSGDTFPPVSFDQSCQNNNTVGILVNNQMEDKWNNVNLTISNVKVQNWTSGIMLWRLGEGSIGANIENSSIIYNTNGIYLWGSNKNNISSNNISGNTVGIFFSNVSAILPQGGGTAMDNIIFNNYFNNTASNTGFFGTPGYNIWNISKTPTAANIIGGTNLGGNFWGNSGGTGWSNTCTDADKDGICDGSFTVNSSNVDYLPLTYPREDIYIDVLGDIVDWPLNVEEENENLNAIDLTVTTTVSNWRVYVTDELGGEKPQNSAGNLTEYDPISHRYYSQWLPNPIQIEAIGSGVGYVPLKGDLSPIVVCDSSTCPKKYDIGVKQVVNYGDPVLHSGHIYKIVITFTGTTKI